MNARVAEFVRLCKAFSTGTLDAAGGRRMNALVRERLAPNYRIPYPAAASLGVPGPAAEDRHLRGLWHELAQHLTDLGYLDAADFLAYHRRKESVPDDPAPLRPVLTAVLDYLREDAGWAEGRPLLDPTAPPPDLAWLTRHLPTLTVRLGLFTGWDGSLPPPENYRPGEANPYGRSLAYRLRVLGSSDFPQTDNGPYFVATDAAVGQLNTLVTEALTVRGNATATRLPRGYWTQLADIDKLLRRYLATAKKGDVRALLYQVSPVNPRPGTVVRPLAELDDDELRDPRLPRELYDLARARRTLRRARRRDDRRDDGLGVRLLQTKLWQCGYYVGALDGAWGTVSHTALKALVADRTEDILNGRNPTTVRGRDRRAAARVRTLLLPANAGQGVYVVDLPGVIELLGELSEAAPRPEELAAETQRLQEEAGVTTAQLDAAVLGEAGVRELYPEQERRPARRVNYDRGGRLRGGLRKVVSWLKRAARTVITATGRVLGPVFNYVKELLRPLRLGVTRFFAGFKFLANFALGRPVVTEVPAEDPAAPPRRFVTRFSLDFDAVTYAPAGFARGGPARHAAHLGSLTADLFYFVDGVVTLIKYVGKLTQPGGWVWLGLRLAGYSAQIPVSSVQS